MKSALRYGQHHLILYCVPSSNTLHLHQRNVPTAPVTTRPQLIAYDVWSFDSFGQIQQDCWARRNFLCIDLRQKHWTIDASPRNSTIRYISNNIKTFFLLNVDITNLLSVGCNILFFILTKWTVSVSPEWSIFLHNIFVEGNPLVWHPLWRAWRKN